MALDTSLHRKFLMAFIVCVCLCGVVGIYVLLFGRFGTLEGRVLATTASVGAASILAMAAAVAWERRRWHPLAPLAMAAVSAALLLTLGFIWELPELWRNSQLYTPPQPNPDYYYERLTASAVIAGLALPHVALLSLARLRRQFQWVRTATIVALTALASLILLLMWELLPGSGEDALIRIMGTLAILDACGSVAVPVLHRVSAIGRREAVRTIELRLPITCPRCRKAQELPVGRSRCACGLRFAIDIEEENCRVCGYALYNLTADRCPECGTPFLADTAHQPIPAPTDSGA